MGNSPILSIYMQVPCHYPVLQKSNSSSITQESFSHKMFTAAEVHLVKINTDVDSMHIKQKIIIMIVDNYSTMSNQSINDSK